ncbi:MAG: zinc metallopeptidase [Lentisphaeria bacterium]
MFGFLFDPLYLILIGPGIILSAIAAFKVKSTFAHYGKIGTYSKLTGAQAAEQMLHSKGVYDVKIERAQGFLGDHYDPSCKTLRLSNEVYDARSISAIGVACHEAGHALQHAEKYAFLSFRTAIVPIVNFSSMLTMPLILLGVFLRPFAIIGVLCFFIAFIFSVVTLPVEWDASARAKLAMIECSFLTHDEKKGASAVLNAAFLTYLSAALVSLLTLLYYLIRLGLLGGRDE